MLRRSPAVAVYESPLESDGWLVDAQTCWLCAVSLREMTRPVQCIVSGWQLYKPLSGQLWVERLSSIYQAQCLQLRVSKSSCLAQRRILFIVPRVPGRALNRPSLIHQHFTSTFPPIPAMSDENTGDPLLEGAELDEETDVFDVSMFESGSKGSGFHTKNNPKDPYQRQQVIQRTGAIDIRCSVLDVVHGVMDPDGDYWATLMVLQFRFDPQRKMRRITEASLELLFDVADPANEIPEVDAISFDGNYSLLPSKQSESTTVGGSGTLGATQIVTASGTAKWEKTVSRETSDKTTVSGGTFVVDNIPPSRIAKWTLLENSTLKSGIPASLQVAVRIKRRDEAVFTCTPTIKCKADKWTSIENFFGKVPEDDPVLLNPDRKPTNKLMVYDTDNLGAVDLQALGSIVPTNMIRDAEKEKEEEK